MSIPQHKMNKTQREEVRAIMYERYKEVAQNIFYIDHCENIETYLEKSDFFPVDWKIQTLRALKDFYIEDPIGNKILASPLNLKVVTAEDREVRRHLMHNVCKFIEEKISELNAIQLTQTSKNIKNENKKNDATLKLSDVFESPTKYKLIMDLLVKKSFCQKDTFIWRDSKGGSKTLLISILKHLHALGYYKDGKRLKEEQIKIISKNTFSVELSSSTIKKAKVDLTGLAFLPSNSITD